MKTKILFVALALLLMCAGVTATKINTTVLGDPGYVAHIYPGDSGSFAGAYSYSPPTGNAIIFTTVNPTTEGRTINFRFSRPSSTDISGYIQTVSTGIFSGNLIVHIDGGSTSTVSYSKFIGISDIPKISFFWVTDGTNYYFMEAQQDIPMLVIGSDYILALDTDTDAYIQTQSPYAAQVKTVSFTPMSTGPYYVESYYASVADVAAASSFAITTIERKTQESLDPFGSIINLVYAVYGAMQSLARLLANFYSAAWWISNLIFAGTAFAGVNAVYIGIAMILSVDKSGGDLFRGIGNFYRYMMALFRFYMEIYRGFKDLIKWW